jgi:hypothetical protein
VTKYQEALIRFEKPGIFPCENGGQLRLDPGFVVGGITMAVVGGTNQEEPCDVVEKIIYLHDSNGLEYALKTYITGYDLWSLVDSAQDVWPEDRFLTSSNCVSAEGMTKLCSDVKLYSDSNRLRAFKYAGGQELYDAVSVTEKMFCGSVEVLLQSRKVLPSGVPRPHWIVIAARIFNDLQTERRLAIHAERGLWFLIPFQRLAWMNTVVPSNEEGGAESGWSYSSVPLPLNFTATGNSAKPMDFVSYIGNRKP